MSQTRRSARRSISDSATLGLEEARLAMDGNYFQCLIECGHEASEPVLPLREVPRLARSRQMARTSALARGPATFRPSSAIRCAFSHGSSQEFRATEKVSVASKVFHPSIRCPVESDKGGIPDFHRLLYLLSAASPPLLPRRDEGASLRSIPSGYTASRNGFRNGGVSFRTIDPRGESRFVQYSPTAVFSLNRAWNLRGRRALPKDDSEVSHCPCC